MFHAIVAHKFNQFALATLVAFVALFATAPRGEARGIWCAGDPAIIVNGSVVSVTVHIPLENLRDVEYVEVVYHVPSNAKVLATVNDSLLFKAKVRYVKDLPPAFGLLGTPIVADITVHHRGGDFPVAATTIATGWGTKLWTEGTTAETLTVKTLGLLNLRLLGR